MGFKRPPRILDKVIRFKAYKHKDGKFSLFDVPGILNPLYNKIYEQRLLENLVGKRKAASIIYASGFLQGKQGFRMTSERFGYAKTIPNKKELLIFTTGQSEITGLGLYEWTRLDFKNELFIVKSVSSPFAEEYRKFFGVQEEHVDYFMRGEFAALVSEAIGKEVYCVESSCITMGKPYCEYIIKPIEKWDEKDTLFINQKIDKMSTIKELGAKMKPYLSTK